MSELILVENLSPIDIFTNEGVDPLLEKIRDEVRKFVPDMTTPSGRKDIASQAYRVSQTKTYLEGAAKDLTSEWKAKAKVVDLAKSKIKKELDSLRDEVRQPLNDWENAEKTRVSRSAEYLETMKFYRLNNTQANNPTQIKDAQARLEKEVFPSDLLEFLVPVQNEYEAAKEYLFHLLTIVEENEKNQLELEALRKKDQERRDADKLEAIKKEAADKARHEEADRQEELRRQTENDKREVQAKFERAEKERLEAIEQVKINDQRAEKEKLEAIELTKKQEQERVAEHAKKEEEANSLRKADHDHRKKINKAANDDVLRFLSENFDFTEGLANELSQKMLTEIIKGNVRYVSVNY